MHSRLGKRRHWVLFLCAFWGWVVGYSILGEEV